MYLPPDQTLSLEPQLWQLMGRFILSTMQRFSADFMTMQVLLLICKFEVRGSLK